MSKRVFLYVLLIGSLLVGDAASCGEVKAASDRSVLGEVAPLERLAGNKPKRLSVRSMAVLPADLSESPSVLPTATPSVNLPAGPSESPSAAPPEVPSATLFPPPTAVPSESPTAKPTLRPTAKPSPSISPSAPLALKNKGAKFYKGGQKGIGYGRVKKMKIYHISSYASDEVKLQPTKKCTFKVVGGIRKRDVRTGKVTVTSDGRVRCRDRAKDKKQYALVRMKSINTGQIIYAHVYFAPRLYAKTPQKQLVYQGKKVTLSFNYPKKKLRFTSSNPKVAKINRAGVVTAGDEGSAAITAKVTGSDRNIVRMKITVREEPWLVNEKDSVYSYEDMTADLREIAHKYNGKASLSSLGTSEDGRNIWCLRIGNAGAGNKLLINAGIHAREWLNPLMIVHKSEEILRNYPEYQSTLNHVCVYVVPMINPDGVTISQSGFNAIRSEKLRKLCKKTHSSHRTWKGNARAVNLNFNFPGGWNPKGKPKKPDGVMYPGEKAASEKETKAMMRFVNGISGLKGALNYHSTGSILYWNYNVENNAALYQKQSDLAARVNSFTKYRLMPKSISTDPNGGFGDWLIYNKKIPNVTVETGSVMCPLPYSQFKKITRENGELLSWFVGEYVK